MSLSRDRLNQYLRGVNIEGKTVLDIGVQDKPTMRLTQGMPANYATIDIDERWLPTVVADLNDPYFAEKVLELTKRTPPGGAQHVFDVGFDVVFCIEVLEHCWNPTQCIQNLAKVLKSNGEVYISTPFINPHHDVTDYLRYTNEWYRDVLPKYGLTVLEIVERQATAGKTQLAAFYGIEGLRVSKIRPEYGQYTYPIGYIVHARKERT